MVVGGIGCNKGLVQAVLAVASFLHWIVYLEGKSSGKFTFSLFLLKSPLIIIREQVWYLKKSEVLKGSAAS